MVRPWALLQGSIWSPGSPALRSNAVQLLSSFVVVLLAPFQVLTGAAMSPSMSSGALPLVTRLFEAASGPAACAWFGMWAFIAVHRRAHGHGRHQRFAEPVNGHRARTCRVRPIPRSDGSVGDRFAPGRCRRGQRGGHVVLQAIPTVTQLMANPFERALSRALFRARSSRQHYSRSGISPTIGSTAIPAGR